MGEREEGDTGGAANAGFGQTGGGGGAGDTQVNHILQHTMPNHTIDHQFNWRSNSCNFT